MLLGDAELPAGVERIIASPGISDSHPLLVKARAARNIEIISDIELFAREATRAIRRRYRFEWQEHGDDLAVSHVSC